MRRYCSPKKGAMKNISNHSESKYPKASIDFRLTNSIPRDWDELFGVNVTLKKKLSANRFNRLKTNFRNDSDPHPIGNQTPNGEAE